VSVEETCIRVLLTVTFVESEEASDLRKNAGGIETTELTLGDLDDIVVPVAVGGDWRVDMNRGG
jgi:hypothetical protein